MPLDPNHAAMTGADPRLARIVALFESLAPADVARLGEFYCADARFKDPFNDVRGLAALQRIFGHMFESLHEPRFVVHHAIAQGDECFIVWDFLFRFRRWSNAPQAVRGTTHLRLAADGRIAVHRDYWDAAEEVYEKLPGIGALLRWIKRRARG